MKISIAAVVALFLIGAPLGEAAADTITMRADDWCPFNCAPGNRPGYGIEVAQAVFGEAGHTIDYRTVAWKRALEDCRKGVINAVIGTIPEESPDFIFPAQPIGHSDNSFVVRKGAPWRFAGIESLATIKLGVNQDYEYGGTVGNYIATTKDRARIDGIGGDTALEQNLRKLAAGRIDATVDSKAVLELKIATLKLGDKVEFAGTTDPVDIFIAFSPADPKSKDYAALLDRGIVAMRASGQLKAILAKYGVTDGE